MGRKTIQIAAVDGSVYVYDLEVESIKKVVDVKELDELPPEVVETLRDLKPWAGPVGKSENGKKKA